MNLDELMAPLEAVLFASGDPVSAQQLMEIFGIDIESLDELVEALQKSLDERGSGIMVQHVAGGWQLATRQELFNYVEKLTETKEKKLSAAAMETLSIIAFKQPITKAEIEHIRGVRIERALQKLLELELIAEVGRKPVLGRPILYGTTDTFLRCFGINTLADLPALPSTEEAAAALDGEQLELFQEVQHLQEAGELSAAEEPADKRQEE